MLFHLIGLQKGDCMSNHLYYGKLFGSGSRGRKTLCLLGLEGNVRPSTLLLALGRSSAIDRLTRSAGALACFASYADPLLSHTEIVSWGPERHSDLGKAKPREG